MEISQQIELFFVFCLCAFFTHWIAIRKKLFFLPNQKNWPKHPPSLSQIGIAFTMYIFALFIFPLLFLKFLKYFARSSSHLSPIAQSFGILAAVFLLYFFLYKNPSREKLKILWKDSSSSMLHDIKIGMLTWLVAFPLVAAINDLSDLFLYLFFQFENYEQIAVLYLKMALSSPFSLVIALTMILIVAPFFEEFLFRGLLQNWLKRFLGIKEAIVISSICFAFFHFSPRQSLGNISLILSLFTFSLYLGFIYERQRSLLACISLHFTFNAVSALRILFS